MILKIRSSDGKKSYSVSIEYGQNGLAYECNCGDQFSLTAKRTACRHVATAVLQLNKVFLNNHVKGGKVQAVDQSTLSEIVSLLEKFQLD